MEQIKEFLSMPELADIISYVLILIVLIKEIFLKKFVKRDNLMAITKFNEKTEKMGELKSEFVDKIKEVVLAKKAIADSETATKLAIDTATDTFTQQFAELKESLVKENELLKQELASVKEALILASGNVEVLVRSGVANKIAKIINNDKESE